MYGHVITKVSWMDFRLPNFIRFGAPLSCQFKTKISGTKNIFMPPLSKAKKSTWSFVDIDVEKESVN